MAETLEGLAAELENGQASSVGLVERAFERIETFDSRLNSFVALDRSGALAAAKESDARRSRGQAHSRLDGIPISVKDNLHVAGFPTTWGSRALKDYRPAKDELPVARLRQAGMIVIGKTNAPEFTLEGYTRNDLFGVTRNPWNHGPHAWRLERRRGGERRGGLRPRCDRHGWRRLDPAPRLPHWPCRLQAIDRPLAARRRIAGDPHRFRDHRIARQHGRGHAAA